MKPRLSLKRRERLVIGVAGIGFVAVVVFVVVILPALQQVRTARQEAGRKKAELTRLVALVERRDQIEQQHAAALHAAHVIEGGLPRDPELPAIVAQLDDALTGSGMQLRQISFDPVPASAGNAAIPGIAAVPLRVQVGGDYRQLRAFIGALERMPRALTVDRLAVTAVQAGIIADLSIRALYAP
ncbi:MAG: type 4a pilus biogenesis protein PilO [bacterium]